MSTNAPAVSGSFLGLLGGPKWSQSPFAPQSSGQHFQGSHPESSYEEWLEDSGYSSLNEDEDGDGPDRLLLNQYTAQVTGSPLVFWSVGDAFPDFSSLGLTDALRLCKELGLDSRGRPLLGFPFDSPFAGFRAAFGRFHREAIRLL